MNITQIDRLLGLTAIGAPLGLLAVLGICAISSRTLSERTTYRLTQIAGIIGIVACLGMLLSMLITGRRHVPIDLGSWVVLPDPHFHFHYNIKLVFDRLSIPFSLLILILCDVIATFGRTYMHKESGYQRFFLLFSIFQAGMILTAVAGTVEMLFTGWELVGLSSALLVGFFQTRREPVRNALRVWMTYRVADAAFLLAAVVMHHLTGEGDFDKFTGTAAHSWPEGVCPVSDINAGLLVGLLLLIAAAGKSALIPFSGWLPRAMEGPTPSSAIFYGALSVHLGAYLLLRVSPLFTLTPWLWGSVLLLGLLTSLYASLTARTQTDIKSALAFASLTQIGLIIAEIGISAGVGDVIGQTISYFALVHLLGHACLRTLQFLRAPSLLNDYGSLENAIGSHLPPRRSVWEAVIPASLQLRVYRLALERGSFDLVLYRLIVNPFLTVFRWCDSLERKWASWLQEGAPSSPHHSNVTLQAHDQKP